MCDVVGDGSIKIFAGGKEALLWELELDACCSVGGGATSTTVLLLSQLIRSKFGPWN